LDLLGDASALIRALEKVGGRFRDVASWRHFSTAERVRFLESASLDPKIGETLRRGLRRWTGFGIVLLVAASAFQAWALARSFPEDRLRADLRLGHYASARARAATIEGLDPRLVDLTARASSLGQDAPPIHDLEKEARVAMSHGQIQVALAWLDLASLRGSEDLDAVASALRALAQKDCDPSRALESRLFEAWREELEACRANLRDRPRPAAQ
jgi:hypothetical protein